MPLSASKFVEVFGEFADKDQDRIDEALAVAETETDATLWGARYERAAFLLAAYELSNSPLGSTAIPVHLNKRNGTKTQDEVKYRKTNPYLAERNELEKRLILGAMIA